MRAEVSGTVIRLMRLEDVETVLAIERATPEAPPWSRADYEQFLVDQFVVDQVNLQEGLAAARTGFVAEVAGRVRGFAVLRLIRVPAAASMLEPEEGGWLASIGESESRPCANGAVESFAELECMVVEAASRGNGLGTKLMNAVLELAVTSVAARVELEVRASNEAAIRLYTRAGLAIEGRRPRYYSHPEEDAILMGKSLEHPPGCGEVS